MVFEHDWHHVSINSSAQELGVTVLFCGEGQPIGKHRIGPTAHDHVLLHTIVAGRGWFESDGKRYTCSAGDTFVILPGCQISYEADAVHPWQYVWAAFSSRENERLLSAIGVTDECCVIRGEPDIRLLEAYRLLQEALQESAYPQLANLQAAGQMQLLLHRLGLANTGRLKPEVPGPSSMERQISRAISWFQLQYAQPLSINHIARSLGYHRTHLSKMFRVVTGLSPIQYLLRIRMERAAQLLQEGELSVKQVASFVGYNDALYFSKQFRKWSGQSPSEYGKRPQPQPFNKTT